MDAAEYKLIALDMDGTVLNEAGEITPENRRWMKAAEAAGVTVMFCTGRGRQGVTPYVEELGLSAPMVLVNGSEVWKAPWELHKRKLMPVNWIRELRRMALDDDVWYWAYAIDGVYNREKWPESEAEVDERQWLKFGYYSEDEAKLAAIRRTLEKRGDFEITNSHPFNIELNPKGISKASGLREICELLGISMSQVIAVGDSVNDLSMIRAAGLGVAMGNAQELIKSQADAVTADNESDGVAQVIRKYIFGGQAVLS